MNKDGYCDYGKRGNRMKYFTNSMFMFLFCTLSANAAIQKGNYIGSDAKDEPCNLDVLYVSPDSGVKPNKVIINVDIKNASQYNDRTGTSQWVNGHSFKRLSLGPGRYGYDGVYNVCDLNFNDYHRSVIACVYLDHNSFDLMAFQVKDVQNDQDIVTISTCYFY